MPNAPAVVLEGQDLASELPLRCVVIKAADGTQTLDGSARVQMQFLGHRFCSPVFVTSLAFQFFLGKPLPRCLWASNYCSPFIICESQQMGNYLEAGVASPWLLSATMTGRQSQTWMSALGSRLGRFRLTQMLRLMLSHLGAFGGAAWAVFAGGCRTCDGSRAPSSACAELGIIPTQYQEKHKRVIQVCARLVQSSALTPTGVRPESGQRDRLEGSRVLMYISNCSECPCSTCRGNWWINSSGSSMTDAAIGYSIEKSA